MKCRVNTSGHFPERFSKDSVSSLRSSNRNCLRQILASKWPNIKWSFCEITSYGKYCNFIGGCQVISRLSWPFKFVHVTTNFQQSQQRRGDSTNSASNITQNANKKTRKYSSQFLTFFIYSSFFLADNMKFTSTDEDTNYRAFCVVLICLAVPYPLTLGSSRNICFIQTSDKYVLIFESMQYSLPYIYFRFIVTFDRNAIFSSSLPQSTLFQSLRRK